MKTEEYLKKIYTMLIVVLVISIMSLLIGAQGRTWTGTGFNTRRILSPVRLPIPPLGQGTVLMNKTS